VDGILFENLDHIRENIANGSQFQQWASASCMIQTAVGSIR
jgi:hypothetical protein